MKEEIEKMYTRMLIEVNIFKSENSHVFTIEDVNRILNESYGDDFSKVIGYDSIDIRCVQRSANKIIVILSLTFKTFISDNTDINIIKITDYMNHYFGTHNMPYNVSETLFNIKNVLLLKVEDDNYNIDDITIDSNYKGRGSNTINVFFNISNYNILKVEIGSNFSTFGTGPGDVILNNNAAIKDIDLDTKDFIEKFNLEYKEK